MTEGPQRRMSARDIFAAAQDGGNKVGMIKQRQASGIESVLALDPAAADNKSLGGQPVRVRDPHGGSGMSNVLSDNNNILPPPPPRQTSRANPMNNEYGDFDPDRREKEKRKAMQQRFDALSKPKSKGHDIYDEKQAAKKGTTYNNRESSDVLWGGAPAPKVPASVGRRLSQPVVEVEQPGKPVSLADLIAMKGMNDGNSDPKPSWNSDFTDAASLRLESIGSINDEDPPYLQQPVGDKKAVANFMKFQGGRRPSGAAAGAGVSSGQDRVVKLNKNATGGRISPKMDQRGALEAEFYERSQSPIHEVKKLSIADYMKSTGQQIPEKKTQNSPPPPKKKVVSMMDYLNKSKEVEVVEDTGEDSDAEQQKALWEKFGMKKSS
ncbi:hypothetical protein TrLO_g4475 [Triparma laevis f. longispina]|uniref:Uncharacterized protein n=1 Tax=Triparma laevis f. longispina TaxID=1714387 RepID=A0A9W7FTN8_9STRA|nr:hypothetical protein TrLO_g4475 [Triparma laevis f. longispina]